MLGACVLLVSACGDASPQADQSGGGAAETGVEAFDLVDVRPDHDLAYEPVAVGDVLVSWVAGDDIEGGAELVTSADLGASWEAAELPDVPRNDLDWLPVDETPPTLVESFDLHQLDGLVVVSAELGVSGWDAYAELDPYVFLWATSDGVDWQGGRVTVTEPGDDSADVFRVWRGVDGQIAVLLSTDGPDQVLQSDDEGTTWRPTSCPGVSAFGEGCVPLHQAGDLWFSRSGAVSSDQGRTWSPVELPSGFGDPLTRFDAAGPSDGGWWLAVAVESDDDGTDGWDERSLLRSDDGVRWERIFDANPQCQDGFPGEWISVPAPFGDRWLIAYSCFNPIDSIDGPRLSELFVLDEDGTGLVAVSGSNETDASYGQPINVDGTLVVAVEDFTTGRLSLRQLRP